MPYIDSHCHLDFPELSAQLNQHLEAMAACDVRGALCVAVCLEDFPHLLELAAKHEQLVASVGVHPGYPDHRNPTVEELVAFAAQPKIVAIGETGLDYYHEHGRSELDWQRECFRTHIRAAIASGKPLIVHTRAAAADTLRILVEEDAAKIGGVMHCFTEDWEVAKACLDLGFYISISGIVTFKNAATIREVAAKVPDDRLLIETDSPYLAPVPHRGKRNSPAFVVHVAAAIAEIRKTNSERIGEITTENFLRTFPVARHYLNVA